MPPARAHSAVLAILAAALPTLGCGPGRAADTGGAPAPSGSAAPLSPPASPPSLPPPSQLPLPSPLPLPPPAAPPPPSLDHAAFVAAVDALAAEALERGPVAGLSIAVFAHGQPVLAKGYGFADVEAQIPATPDTSYPIASVSKHFTAALVLRLADQGRLSLDDPLSRFFPAARPAIGALTLRHLLDHTSGLTRGGPAPRRAAVSVLARGGAARGQGEDWDYSNYNFSLLGLVLEQVSGRDYAGLVHDQVVAPLALAGTGYCEDGTAVPGRGRDYQSAPRMLAPTPYWSDARFFAAGGLCSTVLDLVAWEKALESGRVVSPAMLQAMRTPSRIASGLDVDYGFGTRLGLTGGHRKLGHTGGGQSNKAVLARYPDDDVTVAVLLNTERANATATATGIEERVERLFFAPGDAATTTAPPLAELMRYSGQYRDASRLVRVSPTASGLTMRPGVHHRAESRLVAGEGGAFYAEDDPSYEVRFQVAGGRTLGYGRYHNGWFVALAERAEPRP